MLKPSPKQIEHAQLMGWSYLGDGLFAKGQEVGYYTEAGFIRE